ncbi:Ubiquitin carboxyl-terminal hydrolase 10 [Ananas comosus]|uniref:Ubiquitin carboxyl-terminal hydrolase 10 n=1 Tax=Ananas comosus TaxID=4615 RepID=A0A199UXB8_ANACO|nr:Ubiquitin carboxyl-terminal hydrolase 10 [Ananas comosus]
MTIPSSEGFLAEGSCLPCTPEEEKDIVARLKREAEDNLKDGDLFYLISSRWWSDWQQYVGLDRFDENSEESLLLMPSRPGEIDNSKLVVEELYFDGEERELQQNLQEGQDYTLVPQAVWRKLLSWRTSDDLTG